MYSEAGRNWSADAWFLFQDGLQRGLQDGLCRAGERIDFRGFGTGDGPFSVEEGQRVRQREYYHVHGRAFNLDPI